MAGKIQAIVMPKLGLSMTEGMVAKWHVEEGAKVAPGDMIAEIETSKITNELQAHGAGVIRGSLAEEGVDLPVGGLLCVLADEASSEGEIEAFIAAFKPLDSDRIEVAEAEEASDDARRPQRKDDKARPNPSGQQPPPDDSRIPATPSARRAAARAGINLAEVTPTGTRGRVTREDVEKAAAAAQSAAAPPAQSAATALSGEAYEEVPLTSMRQTIAKRLTASKQAAPHFRLVAEANVDRMLDLRSDLDRGMEDGKISINDLLVKAAAAALMQVPAVNIQFDGSAMRRYAAAHVAVAVALEEGLLTPVIRNANHKSVMEISSEIKELSRRAKLGSLQLDELEGGTFTVSNLGMFGIKAFDAIINPPQAAILAVGATEQRLIPSAGGKRAATIITATLSCDHRVVDGATGARFMQAFKALVEHPYQLLI
ncbi:MAG: dihydrolipoamide acetyltransferase family protein [Gammaproteobacteria bacterium]|nr:dihydrolipoamide acetyltransferase family protein [Gammaproteobacteria bacterium]